jgi:hypothetical protein
MSKIYNRQRRLLLGFMTALGVAAFARPLSAQAVLRQATLQTEIAGKIAAVFGSRQSLSKLGKAYLEQTGSIQSGLLMIENLSIRLGVSTGALSRISALSLRARLKTAISKDFAGGRVVSVKSWILSEPEAWCCAIVALYDRETA